MLQNKKQLKAIVLIAFVFFTYVSCKKEKKETLESSEPVEETTYAEEKLDVACECETNWFPHSQTPAPAEGKGSPFDASSTTNCIFHQWSWQKFLWVTKPQQNGNPLFLNEFYQVSDTMEKIAPVTGSTVTLVDTEQAGSNGILKTNPKYNAKNNTAYTVYYSIHTNPTMFDAATKFEQQLKDGTLKENNDEVFPIGSLELKASWVTLDAIPTDKQSNYFTTTATFGTSDTPVKVALLGMHVVGVVINHPEFIWATFEHNDLAPNYDWKAGNATSPSSEKLLFASGEVASNLDGITFKNGSVVSPNQAYDLFELGVPRVTGGDFMPDTSQKEPENFGNIEVINNCVASNLDDVFKNYFYNGSIWINTDGMTPKQQAAKIVSLGEDIGNATSNSSARGSLNNANVTMETFTQTFESNMSDISVDNLANCFSCHNAVSFSSGDPKSPLYVSHLFDAFIQSQKGKSDDEIDTMKDNQHLVQFLNKSK